ncbi:MAG TPA: hypothetical protein VFT75_11985 [Nocardioidaceae bacterium]|jgi:hypothetical protein|nr:hypothetical protein [Nocardioidaceae bacterium]
MSSSVAARRLRRREARLEPAQARGRSIRRRINAVWGLLYLNTLTYVPAGLLPVPSMVGKAVTQGALVLAILVALTVNPKIRLRPNVFLCLVSLLVLDAAITTMQPRGLGGVYRTFRLAEFVVTLWLLTPWWGRRDLLLLRCHLRWLFVALGTVLVGLLLSPGRALAQDGRLSGLIWPMFPTQVAQYAAVATGLTVVLWLGRKLSGTVALAEVALAAPILVLTHTRTALVSVVAGIVVAGLSLFTINARVRRFFGMSVVLVSLGVMTVAGFATTWLARGESTEGLATLTGRTNFWALVLDQPRNTFQQVFGFGLSNASIDGLPIDSNWLASYMMEGLVGVAVCATIVAFLFGSAAFHDRRVERALGLFLVVYCTLASITEVGFADASTYLLHLTVAASLLAYRQPRLLQET